jgi:hypothetical protein
MSAKVIVPLDRLGEASLRIFNVQARLSSLGDLYVTLALAHEGHPDHKRLSGAFYAIGHAIEHEVKALEDVIYVTGAQLAVLASSGVW